MLQLHRTSIIYIFQDINAVLFLQMTQIQHFAYLLHAFIYKI